MNPVSLRSMVAGTLLIGLVACSSSPTTGNGGGGENDVDAFLGGLPDWEEVAPLEEENSGMPVGEASDPEEELVDNQLYSCRTQHYSLTKNPEQIVMTNPNAGLIWPGALIQGNSHLAGSLRLLALDKSRRTPLGISVEGGGVLGVRSGISTIIEQPVASTVREGINQLIANAVESDVAVGAGFSQFESVESYSATQASLELGLEGRYLGSSASASLDYQRQANEYTYTAYFVQRLFTMSVDQPESPAAFFTDETSAQDLRSFGVSPDNLPLYISSVSYGRILMYSFTSSESRERIEAALEFSYNAPAGGVDGYAEAELEETLRGANIEVLAIGGPNTGVANLIREGNLESYFEAEIQLNQVEPISFNLRNLGNNALARVSNTTEYDVETCEAVIGGTLPQPVHYWTGDGTLADSKGDVDLGGVGEQEVIGAGRFDQGFSFDGAFESANTWPTTELIERGSLFSISAWIRPRTESGVQTIISQLGATTTVGDYAFRAVARSDGAHLQFFYRPSSSSDDVEVVESQTTIPAGEWTHVAVVYGSADNEIDLMRLYVNGQLEEGSDTGNSRYAPTGDAIQLTRVGSSELIVPCNGRCGGRFPFDGSIDELMVFDYPLSKSEVLNMYQNFEVYKE
ncbi:MAG: thiol-activated cytolysin family protein [Trueperaceae bacterium]|nr:thiol-activated cytolysin family protein [Trueperaceae bacterium]